MQPSRQHCLWASLLLLAFLAPAPRAYAAATLTITSTPAGATVEIDGIVVGKTPYRSKFPDGYFHKPHTVFGSRLGHALILRVSMDGYAPEQVNMTDGPIDWVAVTGRREGTYFLLKSDRFDVTLTAASQLSQSARTAIETSRPGPLRPTSTSRAETNQEPPAPNPAESGGGGNGTIALQSEPSGAEIYVDGNFVGQTPATIPLPSGAHRIEVRSAGRPAWVKTLNVLKDSQVTLRATFGEATSPGALDSATQTQ